MSATYIPTACENSLLSSLLASRTARDVSPGESLLLRDNNSILMT